jgi:hypothetical protein
MVHSGLEALASAELAKLGILPYIFSALLLKSIDQNFKNDLQEFLRNLEEFDLKRLWCPSHSPLSIYFRAKIRMKETQLAYDLRIRMGLGYQGLPDLVRHFLGPYQQSQLPSQFSCFAFLPTPVAIFR